MWVQPPFSPNYLASEIIPAKNVNAYASILDLMSSGREITNKII